MPADDLWQEIRSNLCTLAEKGEVYRPYLSSDGQPFLSLNEKDAIPKNTSALRIKPYLDWVRARLPQPTEKDTPIDLGSEQVCENGKLPWENHVQALGRLTDSLGSVIPEDSVRPAIQSLQGIHKDVHGMVVGRQMGILGDAVEKWVGVPAPAQLSLDWADESSGVGVAETSLENIISLGQAVSAKWHAFRVDQCYNRMTQSIVQAARLSSDRHQEGRSESQTEESAKQAALQDEDLTLLRESAIQTAGKNEVEISRLAALVTVAAADLDSTLGKRMRKLAKADSMAMRSADFESAKDTLTVESLSNFVDSRLRELPWLKKRGKTSLRQTTNQPSSQTEGSPSRLVPVDDSWMESSPTVAGDSSVNKKKKKKPRSKKKVAKPRPEVSETMDNDVESDEDDDLGNQLISTNNSFYALSLKDAEENKMGWEAFIARVQAPPSQRTPGDNRGESRYAQHSRLINGISKGTTGKLHSQSLVEIKKILIDADPDKSKVKGDQMAETTLESLQAKIQSLEASADDRTSAQYYKNVIDDLHTRIDELKTISSTQRSDWIQRGVQASADLRDRKRALKASWRSRNIKTDWQKRHEQEVADRRSAASHGGTTNQPGTSSGGDKSSQPDKRFIPEAPSQRGLDSFLRIPRRPKQPRTKADGSPTGADTSHQTASSSAPATKTAKYVELLGSELRHLMQRVDRTSALPSTDQTRNRSNRQVHRGGRERGRSMERSHQIPPQLHTYTYDDSRFNGWSGYEGYSVPAQSSQMMIPPFWPGTAPPPPQYYGDAYHSGGGDTIYPGPGSTYGPPSSQMQTMAPPFMGFAPHWESSGPSQPSEAQGYQPFDPSILPDPSNMALQYVDQPAGPGQILYSEEGDEEPEPEAQSFEDPLTKEIPLILRLRRASSDTRLLESVRLDSED